MKLTPLAIFKCMFPAALHTLTLLYHHRHHNLFHLPKLKLPTSYSLLY